MVKQVPSKIISDSLSYTIRCATEDLCLQSMNIKIKGAGKNKVAKG
jgi:hypothetical protein